MTPQLRLIARKVNNPIADADAGPTNEECVALIAAFRALSPDARLLVWTMVNRFTDCTTEEPRL